MKLQEAKEIVEAMIQWGMVHQGVVDDYPTFDLKPYSLGDLLKANSLVEGNNSRKMKLQEYHSSKSRKSKGVCIGMTISDRAIAALYALIHYPVSDMSCAQFGNKYLAVFKPK